MNFLAHFHLAWPDPSLVAGGLEGDFYKGPLPGDLPAALERGVRLHRAIDAARIGRRLRRDNPLGSVDTALDPVRDSLEQAFLVFYPDLQSFCAGQKKLLN